MKLIPAIDLKNNKCVRLSKGKEETSIIYNENPVKQAKFFEREGCDRIHIVDLDAAFGRREINKNTILKIRKETSINIELGGGIKSKEDVSFWIENGINFLIIGSMAVRNPKKIKNLSNDFPNKLYISLDDLDGQTMIYGWVEKSNKHTKDILFDFNSSNIRGFVFTDVSRDGMLTGIDFKKILQYLSISKKPIIVGGGLSSYIDLKNFAKLNHPNLEGVIAGKSYYLGKIDIKKGQQILDNNA